MITLEERIQILKGNETFSGAQESVLRDIATKCQERECAAGEVLIRQGHKSKTVYIALEGEFAVLIMSGTGEREVARLNRGHVFGEIGAVSGKNATASVAAVTPGRVLSLDAASLHEAIYHSPMLAESVLRSLQRYL